MRVVGGALRGRKLAAPRGRAVRPTSDRVRESIFDLLGVHFGCGRVLDLYAGTGALGVEALSRGCQSAVFVERSRAAVELIVSNLKNCELTDRGRVVSREVIAFLKSSEPDCAADLVLIDPPYGKGLVPKTLRLIESGGWLAAAGVVVCETEAGLQLPEQTDALERLKQRVYGDTAISLFRFGRSSG